MRIPLVEIDLNLAAERLGVEAKHDAALLAHRWVAAREMRCVAGRIDAVLEVAGLLLLRWAAQTGNSGARTRS
jgi:hypothetical protein